MRSEGRTLPKATPALARRVWARQQRPSARRVARAMQQAGYPVHFVTVARWRAQNWRAKASDQSVRDRTGWARRNRPIGDRRP
jgi:hypothetical protein